MDIRPFASLLGSTDDAVLYPLQPKFGGMVIDIVSRDIQTPQQQAEALEAVKNTIMAIILIVVTGYGNLCPFPVIYLVHLSSTY